MIVEVCRCCRRYQCPPAIPRPLPLLPLSPLQAQLPRYLESMPKTSGIREGGFSIRLTLYGQECLEPLCLREHTSTKFICICRKLLKTTAIRARETVIMRIELTLKGRQQSASNRLKTRLVSNLWRNCCSITFWKVAC